MPRSPRKLSLRITDFSDRELLALAIDLSNSEGVIDIQHLAEQIWPKTVRDKDGAATAHRCIGTRFTHMSKWGVIERVKDEPGHWQLTDLGDRYARGKLTTAQQKSILGSQEGQELELMALIGDLFEDVDDDAATLMRREFQFRAYRRRWG